MPNNLAAHVGLVLYARLVEFVRRTATHNRCSVHHHLRVMRLAVGRTAALCLLHDAHETRIGDVPSVGRAYVTTAAPEAVTVHQTSAMPDPVAKVVQELVAE